MEKKNNVVSKCLQKQLNELVSNRQYDEAIRLLEPVARKGNADAQYKMGKLLYKKMTYTGARFVLEDVAYWMNKEKQQAVCPEDYPDANQMIYWYEEAAKQGHLKAIVELAGWYIPFSCDSSQVGRIIKQSPSFALKSDLERALSLYMQALDAGDDSFLTLQASNLLHSRHVPKEIKDKIVGIFYDWAEKGSWHAADSIFRIIETKLRFPEHKPYYDIEIDEHELLHADWFRLLLDHETECEKEKKYSGRNALHLLSYLAETGNEEALHMLTDIGMRTRGLSVCLAGDVYYERKEYKKALECYLAGEAVYKLGEMYERGEGTAPDMEKAFQYYEEAEDHFNMGRMYEQGLGTKKDLWKALDCYRHYIDGLLINSSEYEERNEKILYARRSFRRLKKVLYKQKDEVIMTVVANKKDAICTFSFTSYNDCAFTIDWGDGYVKKVNNEKGGEIHLTHSYEKAGKWHIHLKSNETHTLTALHYNCETCVLKVLDVTQCPILLDLYCVNQGLRYLNVSNNPRLERLVCRGNRLRTLNIWKNYRLTQLDCSDNPGLRHVDWHPRYAALSMVCMKNTAYTEQLAPLTELLKLNKGKMCDAIMETPLTPVCLPLSYYMRCMTWNGVKAKMKEGGYPISINHSWAKYKSAFDDMRSRNDFHYAGSNRIVCEGGYTHCECFHADKKEYVHQDLEDMLINSTPWSETLDMPVLMREKEGWMMFPLATWADVFCDCFSEMTYSHWKETEKIVRSEQEFWEWLREQQK